MRSDYNLKPDQFISIKCNELDSVITRGRNNDPKFTGLSEQIIRNRNVIRNNLISIL